jgi:hypothetical protein
LSAGALKGKLLVAIAAAIAALALGACGGSDSGSTSSSTSAAPPVTGASGTKDPSAIADCISKAGGDTAKIQACVAQ